MKHNRKLLILDIDNTLLHTVILSGDSSQEYSEYRNTLLSTFDGAEPFPDEDRAIIVPRPNLATFIDYLISVKSSLDIGVFSTARPDYLKKVISLILPWIIGNAKFIWGEPHCHLTNDILAKDLNKASGSLGYNIDHIRMIDDQDVVWPRHQRIHIEPFFADEIDYAMDDRGLLSVINDINRWLKQP